MEDGLRERVRERLLALISHHITGQFLDGEVELADAILREFRIQPVSVGTVGEGGEVKLGMGRERT